MQAPGCLSPLKVYGIVWLCCDISLKEPTLALEITVFIHWFHLFTSIQLLDKMSHSLQPRGPILSLIFKENHERKKSIGLGVF